MRLNKTISLFLCSLLLLVFAGCTKNGREPANSNLEIRLGASLLSVENSTRAIVEGTALANGAKVGIFALADPNAPTWTTMLINNGMATVVRAGLPMDLKNGADNYLYTVGSKHDFYAYYPYTAGVAMVADMPVINNDLFTDLDSESKQIDWLYGKATEITPRSTAVPLVLSHAMSLVKFDIFKDVVVTSALTLEQIIIETSTSQKFTFDIATGTVTSVAGGATTFTQDALNYTVLSASGTASHPVLLLPLSTITRMTFVINGESYSTNDGFIFTTLAAGHGMVAKVEITPVEILITIGEGEWGDGGEVIIGDHRIETSITVGEGAWTDGGNTNVSDVVIPPAVTLGDGGFGNSGSITVIK